MVTIGMTFNTGSRDTVFAFKRIISAIYEGVHSSTPTRLTEPHPAVVLSYTGGYNMRNAAADDHVQRPALF